MSRDVKKEKDWMEMGEDGWMAWMGMDGIG
jgi:hypothetical protein